MAALIRTANGNEVKIDLRHTFPGGVGKSGKDVVQFDHIGAVNPDRAQILSNGVTDETTLFLQNCSTSAILCAVYYSFLKV